MRWWQIWHSRRWVNYRKTRIRRMRVLSVATSRVSRQRKGWCSRVHIARRRGSLVNFIVAFTKRQFQSDLPLGPTQGVFKLQRFDLSILWVDQETLSSLRRVPTKGFNISYGWEWKISKVSRESLGEREWQNTFLVPYGSGRPWIIRLGGEATIRVNPEDDVRPEFTLTPIDIFQVLCWRSWRRDRRTSTTLEAVNW